MKIPETSDAGDSAVETSSPPDAQATDAGEVPTEQIPDAVKAYGGSLSFWQVSVPEDWQKPGGTTIRLAVTRLKSTSQAAAEPVVILSGGPGNDATTFFNLADMTRPFIDGLRAERDVILLDQRGTGYSEPRLACESGDDAKACRDRLVGKGINLAVYNTASSVQDIKAVLKTLQLTRASLYGVSYGTFLAQAVMREMPEVISSVVLDCTLPTTKTVSRGGAAGRLCQDGIEALFADCASDDTCKVAYPNIQDEFYSLLDKLDKEPAKLTVSDGAGAKKTQDLSGSGFAGAVESILLSPSKIPYVPAAIFELRDNRFDGQGIQTLFAAHASMDARLMSDGQFRSVFCHDMLSFDTLDSMLAANAKLKPIFKANADATAKAVFEICETWDVGRADDSLRTTVQSDIPTLVLAGQFDVQTSPSWGKLVAETLSKSFYLEVPRTGHGTTQRECARSLVHSFLAHPETQPDTGCFAALRAKGFYK